jgi:hypothetical protein
VKPRSRVARAGALWPRVAQAGAPGPRVARRQTSKYLQ